MDGLYGKLGEYESLDELNYLASKLDEMSESEYAQFQAGMEMGDHCGSLQEIINLTENLDCYEVYPDIHDYDDLGRYYIDELEVMQVPEHLQNYIDYEAYGRDVAMDENGTFTDQGYVRDTGDSFREYYGGGSRLCADPGGYHCTGAGRSGSGCGKQLFHLSAQRRQ